MPIIVSVYQVLVHHSNGSSKSLSFPNEQYANKYAFENGAVAISVKHRQDSSTRFTKKS